MHRDVCARVLASGYVKGTERDEQAEQTPWYHQSSQAPGLTGCTLEAGVRSLCEP